MAKVIGQSRRRRLKRFSFYALIAIAVWSLGLGWGIARAIDRPNPANSALIAQLPASIDAGKDLYVNTCSGCHIAIPPGVLPTQTWKRLLEKPEDHYGTSVKGIIRISQLLMWNYLQAYSRPLPSGQAVPLYVDQSRYFKILHPRVEFNEPVSHKTCIRCHPGVNVYDFRSLSPEWENAQ